MESNKNAAEPNKLLFRPNSHFVINVEKPASRREAPEGSVCPVGTCTKCKATRKWELIQSNATGKSAPTIKVSGHEELAAEKPADFAEGFYCHSPRKTQTYNPSVNGWLRYRSSLVLRRDH